MKIKTSELTGKALDWAVASCEGEAAIVNGEPWIVTGTFFGFQQRPFSPSTKWAQGGPIIEREGIRLCVGSDGEWDAELCEFDVLEQGPTPLIAAMRCYVVSKLGETVDVPDALVVAHA